MYNLIYVGLGHIKYTNVQTWDDLTNVDSSQSPHELLIRLEIKFVHYIYIAQIEILTPTF